MSAMVSFALSLPGPDSSLSAYIHTHCGEREREGEVGPSQSETAAGRGSGTCHLFSPHLVSLAQATPSVLMGTDSGMPPVAQCGWMT